MLKNKKAIVEAQQTYCKNNKTTVKHQCNSFFVNNEKKSGDIFVNIKICNILVILWGIKNLSSFLKNIVYVNDLLDNWLKIINSVYLNIMLVYTFLISC